MSRLKKSKSTEPASEAVGEPAVPEAPVAPEPAIPEEAVLGPVRRVRPRARVVSGRNSHVPSLGPGVGEMRGNGAEPPPRGKIARDFLYPPMPGAFQPSVIRKLPVEKLRERYLKVLGATMGNHSIALFYCDWSQEQFEAALNLKFRKAIAIAKSQLADRATFIMHKSMGLIADGEEIGPVNAQVTSALAKVVESLKAKDVEQESGGGFKLIVEGLDRSKPAPVPPAVPAAVEGQNKP